MRHRDRRHGVWRHRTRRQVLGRQSGGFTLFEVMVAFLIAILALGVLYHSGIDGLLTARVAGRMEEAVARAQSRLTALCHGAKLADGVSSGDDGSGFAWRSQVSSVGTANVPRGSAEEPARPLHATLFAVRVTVSWGGMFSARAVSLDTSCLSLAPSDTL